MTLFRTPYILVAAIWFACVVSRALGGGPPAPQGEAFTYQGVLKSGGAPASGTYHLRFQLWDALSGGTQVGSDFDAPALAIENGLFTIALDFGSAPQAFDGSTRWLAVQVITDSGATVITLVPRQPIMPTPYALYALSTPPLTTATFPTGGGWALSSGLSLDSGTLHVDPVNDRVGIGTAAPTSTLHVVGNTTLTGNVAVTGILSLANVPTLPATTRTLSINPAEFESIAGGPIPSRSRFSIGSTAPPNNPVEFFAPLALPDGAVVTDVTFLVKDNDFSKTMTCSLVRDDTTVGDSTVQEMSTTIGSGTSAPPTFTFQAVSITGLPHTIDNTGHSYVLVATWTMPTDGSTMNLRRVEVTYTITAPLP